MSPEVMTEAQVAEQLLGVSSRSLESRRQRGGAVPPHFRIGRAVRYRRSAVLEWIVQQEQEMRGEQAA